MLKINDKMPNFEILTDKVNLSINHFGKNSCLFFPKADTSGCAESIAFTNLQTEFDQLNCIVIGISKDNSTKLCLEISINSLVSLVLISKIMYVNNLEFGSKNPCTEENIWEFKGPHFCPMKIMLLVMFGKKSKCLVMQMKF